MSPKRSRSRYQPEIKGSAKKRPKSSAEDEPEIMAEDEPEIMYTKVRYQYTSEWKKYGKMKRVEALWSRVEIPVTFLKFKHSSEVSRVLGIFQKLNHVSIPRVLGQLKASNELVVEQLPTMTIRDWLRYEGGQMWTVDLKSKQFLELEKRHSIVFRGIVMALAYLHEKGISHGNLKNGIFVTDWGHWAEENPRICLANFDTTTNFDTGFKRDLEDLKYLVKRSVKYHSKPIKVNDSCPKEPAALQAFFNLYDDLKKLKKNFTKMRTFATFIYWAPVFYDWKDRRDFLNCVENFSNQDFLIFKNLLIDADSLSSKMKGWAARISPLGFNHPLQSQLFLSPGCKRFSGGLYWLHRNGLHHFKGSKDKDSDQEAMEQFFLVFPEAISEIFDAVMAIFHYQRVEEFGKEFVKFLKEADNQR